MLKKLLILLSFTAISFAQKEKDMLKKNLDQYIGSLAPHLRVSMSFNALYNHKIQYHRNANQLIPAASLIKLPVLVELYAQDNKKKLNRLDDDYILNEKDIANGDGSLHKNSVGQKFKLSELARLMMVASDNSATNILIDKLTKEAINDRMQKEGFQQIYLNRKMMDTAAINLGIQNFVSAREYNLLLEKIYNYDILEKKSCQKILYTMTQCNDKDAFRVHIPAHIDIAHKTGSLSIVRSDAGIFFAPKPFVLTALVEGFKTEAEANQVLTQIALICYQVTNLEPTNVSKD